MSLLRRATKVVSLVAALTGCTEKLVSSDPPESPTVGSDRASVTGHIVDANGVPIAGAAAVNIEPRVLFVGSIFNRRHVPELVEGFARLARAHPDARLEIVGENRTSPHVDLAGTVRAAGLHDCIQLRSYVTDHELHALYAGARAFAFLSAYEGFGLTPLEAMAAGLPVLLLDTPVAREICGDAAMYVKRPDPTLIEDALTTLLFDARERQRLREAADRLLEKYSWTECARQVLKVLLASGRG